MTTLVDALDQLMAEARERELSPQAWWLGVHHHERALSEPGLAGRATIEDGAVSWIDELPVKVLVESPDRLALWCREGALDVELRR